MSSRNVHLSPKEREQAPSINKSLLGAKSAVANGQIDCDKLRNLVIQAITEAGGRIDYVERILVLCKEKKNASSLNQECQVDIACDGSVPKALVYTYQHIKWTQSNL